MTEALGRSARISENGNGVLRPPLAHADVDHDYGRSRSRPGHGVLCRPHRIQAIPALLTQGTADDGNQCIIHEGAPLLMAIGHGDHGSRLRQIRRAQVQPLPRAFRPRRALRPEATARTQRDACAASADRAAGSARQALNAEACVRHAG